ncbi:MAG: ELWxxDGT repeat protein [Cyanobacteria bacterium P01_A01_bin.83]
MSVNVVGFLDFPPSNLIDADTSIFFASSGGIWQSGGEETGVSLVFPPSDSEELENFNFNVSDAVGGNGNLLFSASENEFGQEPWISDGTLEGTRILKDINTNGSSNPQNFFELDGTFYFTAEDGINQRTLWKSDGTTEGTELIPNIEIRNFQGLPPNFTDFNGTLIFFTAPGVGDHRLWKSDGTGTGTELIRSFGATLEQFTVVDDTLYFVTDQQLWKSDGTTEGTQLVAQVSTARELTSVDDALFFVQSNPDIGEELWKSDGTPEGTVLVRDIRPEEQVNGVTQNFSSEPEDLIDVNGTLFFTADDGVNGRELWTSDGTSEGTQLVIDLKEGEDSSITSDFTHVNGTLYFQYFNSNDEFLGELSIENQLWQSDGTQAGTFEIEAEELSVGGEQVEDSFIVLGRDNSELLEFNDQLYFTGEAFSFDDGGYQPALLTLADVDNTIVYRLFNPNVGVHFYTTDVAERDEFVATGNYQSEGESYRSVEPSAEDAEDVFRFFNETTGVYLYTTSELERDVIIDTLPDFTFEGARFSAYETEVEGSIPIYRFFEPSIGVHLYTPSEIERDAVQEDLPNYTFEGIAYYALPLESAEL